MLGNTAVAELSQQSSVRSLHLNWTHSHAPKLMLAAHMSNVHHAMLLKGGKSTERWLPSDNRMASPLVQAGQTGSSQLRCRPYHLQEVPSALLVPQPYLHILLHAGIGLCIVLD